MWYFYVGFVHIDYGMPGMYMSLSQFQCGNLLRSLGVPSNDAIWNGNASWWRVWCYQQVPW